MGSIFELLLSVSYDCIVFLPVCSGMRKEIGYGILAFLDDTGLLACGERSILGGEDGGALLGRELLS